MAGSVVSTQGLADTLEDIPPIPPKKRDQYHSKGVEDGGGDYDHLHHGDQRKYFIRGHHMTESPNGIDDEKDGSYSHLIPRGVSEESVPRMYPVTRDSVHIPEWQLAQDRDDAGSEGGGPPPPLPPKPASISPPRSEQLASGVPTKQEKKHKKSYQQFVMHHGERLPRAGLAEEGEEQPVRASRSEAVAVRLKTTVVEQRQDTRDPYELLAAGQPSSEGAGIGPGEDVDGEGHLHRVPSLEWDSADLPAPQRDSYSRTAEEVQDSWKREHAARMEHSYSEVVIPDVQQKWIEEHDRVRKDRPYEEVDFDWNFRSGAAAHPSAHPSAQPKGHNKGWRRNQGQSVSSVEESASSALQREVESINRPLPEGWQAELSHGQVIYWHVPTGRIQFAPPTGLEPCTVSRRGSSCGGGLHED